MHAYLDLQLAGIVRIAVAEPNQLRALRRDECIHELQFCGLAVQRGDDHETGSW